jgi:hypothetical protein
MSRPNEPHASVLSTDCLACPRHPEQTPEGNSAWFCTAPFDQGDSAGSSLHIVMQTVSRQVKPLPTGNSTPAALQHLEHQRGSATRSQH